MRGTPTRVYTTRYMRGTPTRVYTPVYKEVHLPGYTTLYIRRYTYPGIPLGEVYHRVYTSLPRVGIHGLYASLGWVYLAICLPKVSNGGI